MGAVPEAATVKVAVAPGLTDYLAGWVVMILARVYRPQLIEAGFPLSKILS